MTRRVGIPWPEVTVESTTTVDPDDLYDQGWHHEKQCGMALGKSGEPTGRPAAPSLADVAQELHRAQHPQESLWLAHCTASPCADLRAAWG